MINFQSLIREKFANKRAVVTGGLGFIGSNLAARLVGYDSDVLLFTRSREKFVNIREISDQVRTIQGSMTDADRVVETIKNADYIFHLAAQTSNIHSMEDPLADLETNAKGTLNLLEACRRHNPNAQVVTVGTVTQAGKPLRLPVDESHPDAPLTVYDADKLLCENYFRVYHSAFGLKTSFLRLSTLFGERQSLRSSRTGTLNYFIGKALQGETIRIFGEGDYMRDYLYVQDVVDALLLSAITDEANGESFILSTGKGTLFIEMVKTIISIVREIAGKESRYEIAPWPKEWKTVDVGSFVGSPEKFERITGWSPRTSFEQGVRNTVKFYSQHLSEYL